MVEPGLHPFLHARRRQRDKAARGRRLRQAGAVRGRHIAPGQADRPLEFVRRDVDQHLVHRPFAKPIFADRALPAWQNVFLAVEIANARTLDLDLAAVETDLALRSAPAMRPPALVPRMTRAANRLGVLIHHFAQRLDPRRQAKSLETRRHARQRLGLQRMRGNRRRCDMFLHGVAFLSWNQRPEPTGSRRATPLLHFQHSAGHPQFRPGLTEVKEATLAVVVYEPASGAGDFDVRYSATSAACSTY